MRSRDKRRNEMKKYFASFAVVFAFLAAFASGQTAPQSDAPRKASTQFIAAYDRAKKHSDEIIRARTDADRARAAVEIKLHDKVIFLQGEIDFVSAQQRQECADRDASGALVTRDCRYDEATHIFVLMPKAQPPATAPAPAPTKPAEPKPDESKTAEPAAK
jgi:hypothetical protein